MTMIARITVWKLSFTIGTLPNRYPPTRKDVTQRNAPTTLKTAKLE